MFYVPEVHQFEGCLKWVPELICVYKSCWKHYTKLHQHFIFLFPLKDKSQQYIFSRVYDANTYVKMDLDNSSSFSLDQIPLKHLVLWAKVYRNTLQSISWNYDFSRNLLSFVLTQDTTHLIQHHKDLFYGRHSIVLEQIYIRLSKATKTEKQQIYAFLKNIFFNGIAFYDCFSYCRQTLVLIGFHQPSNFLVEKWLEQLFITYFHLYPTSLPAADNIVITKMEIPKNKSLSQWLLTDC